MKAKSYFKNAAILTATGVLLRVAGMLFRVYIAAQIGAGGMGLYQLIFTVYTLAATLATAGVSIVATRIASEILARGEIRSLRYGVRKVMLLSVSLGILAAVLLYIGAPYAAKTWLVDVRAALALRILAPSLPFMAVSAALRGFFMARREVAPNARAQIFEQLVRIAVVAYLLQVVGNQDIGIACAAVVLGNTVSEACSWVLMMLAYRRDVRGLPTPKEAKPRPMARYMMNLLFPIAASQYLTSVLHTVENVLVPASLAIFIGTRSGALEQYGALKGMAMPVLFFPFSFITALATLLLPEITEAYVQKKTRTIKHLISRVMLITMSLSMMASLVFTVFSREIGLLLYKSEEIGFYIGVLGPLMSLMYLESMVDGILKGLNEQVATLRYSVVDSILRISLIWLLLPRFGMKGFLFVMLVSNLFTGLLNVQRLLKVTQMPMQWMAWLARPAFAAIGAGIAVQFVLAPLLRANVSLLLWTLIAALAACGFYLLLLWLMGGIKFADFK